MDEYEVRAAKIIQEAKNSGHSYAGNHPVYWNIESLGDDYGIGCFFDEEEKVWKLYENFERGSHYIFMVTDDENETTEKLSRRICAVLKQIDDIEEIRKKKAVTFLTNKLKFMELTEVYGETRSQVLALKASDIGLTDLEDDTIYAAVIDISQENGTATIVCTLRGDVEYYHSPSEVHQKLEKDENVKEAASKFLISAKDQIRKAAAVNDFSLPKKDTMTLHYLTNSGIFRLDLPNDEKVNIWRKYTDELIKAVMTKVKELRK